MSANRKYLLIALAGSLLLLPIELLYPLNFDNMIFQSMASELFRFHRFPYLGTWAHDVPGLVFLHWLGIVFFGDTAVAFRAFDASVHLAMSGLLFVLVRRWLSPTIACTSVLFYNYHYISNASIAGQRDAFVALFLVAALTCFFRSMETGTRTNSMLFALLTGMAVAAAGWIRITCAMYAPIFFFFLRNEDQVRLRVAFVAGVVVVLLAGIVPYALVPGGIEQAYLTVVRFNLDLYAASRDSIALLLLGRIKYSTLIPLLAGIAVVLVPQIRRQFLHVGREIANLSRGDRNLLIALVLAGLASVVLMGKYYSYHLEPVLILLIPFGAIAIYSFVEFFSSRVIRYVLVVLLAGVALFHCLHESRQASVWTMRNEIDSATALYLDRSLPANAEFASISFLPGLRWRTQHAATSRFTTLFPILAATRDGKHPAFQKEWQGEYVDSLRALRPPLVVLDSVTMDIFPWFTQPPVELIHTLPGFDSLIWPYYAFDTAIGNYRIFRRRS